MLIKISPYPSACPEFKKQPTETQLEAFKPLLKAYQGEIDALTRRSKASESAFLSAYKLLAEAPDPYPLLDAAVVRPSSATCAARIDLLTRWRVTPPGPDCQGR